MLHTRQTRIAQLADFLCKVAFTLATVFVMMGMAVFFS